jgi:transcriptional pleiotropic regulator of transition state genes
VLQINADDEQITIRKAEAKCVFCNAQESLTPFKDKHICDSCLAKLREQ